jgi:cytoskeletal protein RodZ
MAWFRRKESNQTVLPEIERYYEAERHERAGLAWILALVSVACVALIVIGLVFGGRWLYRKMTTDTNKPVATQTENKTDNSSNQTPANPDNDSKSNNPTSPAPTTDSQINTPTAATPSTTQNPSTSQSTASTNNNLPTTGAESVVPAFLGATLFGALVYRLKLRKNSN